MNTSPINTILLIVVVVALVGGGVWWYKTYGPGASQENGSGINVEVGGSSSGY